MQSIDKINRLLLTYRPFIRVKVFRFGKQQTVCGICKILK